jgi:hypothetical protein
VRLAKRSLVAWASLVSLVIADSAYAQMTDPLLQPSPFSSLQTGAALAPWAPVRLGIALRPTRYDLVADGDQVVLHAVANAAASGLAHPVAIDTGHIRVIAWRWKIAGLIRNADLRVAAREDAPARVVLEFDGDKSKLTAAERGLYALGKYVIGRELPYASLAYVWSNELPVDTIVESAHSRRIRMIVATTGSSGVGTWQSVTRDVHADFQRAFGESPGRLQVVGVLTDTDDTGGHAEAWYGDIRFTTGAR